MADDTLPVTKVCSKCGETKPRDAQSYGRNRNRPDGLAHHCLECSRAADRERYPDRREARLERGRKHWASLTPEQKVQKAEEVRKWKAENPDNARAIEVARLERIKAQKAADPEFRKAQNKRVRDWQNNKRRTDPEFREKANADTRRWHRENKDRQNAYKRKLNAERRKFDVAFRLRGTLRSRLKNALKGRPTSAAIRLLGCSVEQLRAHIEGRFQCGMTWENWGRGWGGAREWHIDHIKPLASFDLTDPAQLAEACHYTNLQPLWAFENLSKGAGEWQERPS